MTGGIILLIVLAILLIGVFPFWPYAGNWGYYPSAAVSLLMIIVIVLMLIGRV